MGIILTTIIQRAIDNRIADLQTQQTTYIATHSRYQQILKTVAAIGDFSYEVHEHLAPKGLVGFTIYLYKTVDGITYVKSRGFGVDAELHTQDWAEYKPNQQ